MRFRIYVAERWVRQCVVVAALGLAMAGLPSCAHAAAVEDIPDLPAIAQLEQQAASAQPREQCFLYTEVVHDLTEVAGRQIANGEEDKARETLKHMDLVVAKLHTAVLRDAKRLKNAEMLMEHSTRRLGDMLHVASEDSRTVLQSALQHLSSVHSEVLAQVFAR